MTIDKQLRPVVSDNGTGYVKLGFAGQNFPEFVFPSMVGRPLLRYDEGISDDGVELKDIMCGTECAENRSMLETRLTIFKLRVWSDLA